jgi:hypothetical protein
VAVVPRQYLHEFGGELAHETNAQLIASAPCLLAALSEFVRLTDDGNATAEQWGVARAEAVQAINAATGS